MIVMVVALVARAQKVTDYVDPRIGSEGLGRVCIAPCCPYGMVKPSPDCTVEPNSGWLPMPEQVDGFAQVHVSGTGGGPKYGNILTMPIWGEMVNEANSKKSNSSMGTEGESTKGREFKSARWAQHRIAEEIKLGYYSCTFAESGICTEITAAERASFYRHTYPTAAAKKGVAFDLQFFLGRNPMPKAREAQQYEDSELQVINDSVQCGWQRISGGWNNGAPYTVYFYSVTREEGKVLLQKIGISFVSVEKATQNLTEDIPHWDFERTHKECVDKWEAVLGKVSLSDDTPLSMKRMFYTALYHTMIMPVDRTKDNGLYDDYYAIWDTYRTSTPLITLLDPDRATAIASSLLDIYRKDGFLPDARSGNSNGRTQGGSNAEIVFADALAKGLKLNWKLALEAMLKDATVAPQDDEAEGRGGLAEYNSLGYIPYGIARGGNRTVEYSFCDWAIAQVAKHLHKDKIYAQYMKQSERWKNLWRKDYTHDGASGFIMPQSREGAWLDSVPFGHSKLQPQHFLYTPDVSYEGPWYCAWWDCYFYEASSWEYSLSIPHDIPALIEACGGKDAFERRLDTFFAHKYYNVANEPSFLTPCLYHWIGKPEKSSERVKAIVEEHFNDSPKGLPGNDDSGSMSSWLAFHSLGIYPNAGHDYYLIHTPLVNDVAIALANGKTLHIHSMESNTHRVTFNDKELTDWRITHAQLMQGGELIIEHPKEKSLWDRKYRFRYSLHGQTRRFSVSFAKKNEQVTMSWSIERNLKMWHGDYTMSPVALQSATSLNYTQPLDGQHIALPDDQTFAIISRNTLKQIKEKGECSWCNTRFKVTPSEESPTFPTPLIHLVDIDEGAEMWVSDCIELPIIVKMKNNPVEIDWEVSEL